MSAELETNSNDHWPRPVFRVELLAESVAYYRDRLGFEVDWMDQTVSPPSCGQVSRDGVTIILDQNASFPKASVPTVLSVTLGDSATSPLLDGLHRELARSGARVTRSPSRVPWDPEVHQMDIADLDGNLLMFWGHVPGQYP